jgi:hypothetical protein
LSSDSTVKCGIELILEQGSFQQHLKLNFSNNFWHKSDLNILTTCARDGSKTFFLFFVVVDDHVMSKEVVEYQDLKKLLKINGKLCCGLKLCVISR